jgi:hypothetical protein
MLGLIKVPSEHTPPSLGGGVSVVRPCSLGRLGMSIPAILVMAIVAITARVRESRHMRIIFGGALVVPHPRGLSALAAEVAVTPVRLRFITSSSRSRVGVVGRGSRFTRHIGGIAPLASGVMSAVAATPAEAGALAGSSGAVRGSGVIYTLIRGSGRFTCRSAPAREFLVIPTTPASPVVGRVESAIFRHR